jgi:Lrp/AsnC family transcriptional regulator for asnA, asnC and gidA
VSPAPLPHRLAGSPAIDELDRQIIRILQRNGRASNTSIARDLNVTETTIRKRIGALLDESLINIVAIPTPEAMGASMSAIIGISVSLPEMHNVAERLVAYREVRYCGMGTGRFDIILETFFADQDHLLEFVTNQVGALPGVTKVETSLILRVAKFSYEWELP